MDIIYNLFLNLYFFLLFTDFLLLISLEINNKIYYFLFLIENKDYIICFQNFLFK